MIYQMHKAEMDILLIDQRGKKLNLPIFRRGSNVTHKAMKCNASRKRLTHKNNAAEEYFLSKVFQFIA